MSQEEDSREESREELETQKAQETTEEELGRQVEEAGGYECKYCHQVFPTLPLLGAHSKSCPERLKAIEPKEEEIPLEKEKAEWEGVPPLQKSGMSMREYVAFYGTVGLERLKRDRLIEFLTVAPGVGRRSVAWIMKQYDMDPNVRRDLNSLMSLLTSAGVKQDISYRICSALAALEEEFSDLLAQPRPLIYPMRRHEGAFGYPVFQSFPQPSQRIEPFPLPRYTQPPQYPPQPYTPYDYGYQPQRVEDVVRRAIEEEFKRRESQQQAQVQTPQVVTITEPLRDSEGKLVYDRDGNPVYRKIVGPLGQVGMVSEDPELRALRKLKEFKDLTKPEKVELSEERIRSIIREEMKEKEEKITKEDIYKASEEAAARVLAQREQEDKEEERFRRLEKAIRESAGAKTVEGYQADAYRLIGQGMQTLATREPKTVKIIIEGVKDILYGPEPTRKEVEPGASEGIFERLDRKYVAQE